MVPHISVIIFFACWGSFLNVVGYRLIKGLSIAHPRSFCPACSQQIAWYDNIPVLSWIMLHGRCRHCLSPISLLYPLIEIFSTTILYILYSSIESAYFIAYFIFFSALIVNIRSDFETMLLSSYMTLGIIPVGLTASYFGYLPITLYESISGATFGFLLLWCISALFTWYTGKKGMGEGDMDLLALIGSFIGPFGAWTTLLIASTTGSIGGLILIACNRVSTDTRVPFGPFLALGAIIFVFWRTNFLLFLST